MVISFYVLFFMSGLFGNEVSRVLGGGLVPGLIQFLIYINMSETIYMEFAFWFSVYDWFLQLKIIICMMLCGFLLSKYNNIVSWFYIFLSRYFQVIYYLVHNTLIYFHEMRFFYYLCLNLHTFFLVWPCLISISFMLVILSMILIF